MTHAAFVTEQRNCALAWLGCSSKRAEWFKLARGKTERMAFIGCTVEYQRLHSLEHFMSVNGFLTITHKNELCQCYIQTGVLFIFLQVSCCAIGPQQARQHTFLFFYFHFVHLHCPPRGQVNTVQIQFEWIGWKCRCQTGNHRIISRPYQYPQGENALDRIIATIFNHWTPFNGFRLLTTQGTSG